ncbi:hypothetical protein NIES4074_39550 [Cylindrospermum sp. NIES-4074]|jgi:hypothetical protein|nr:hypothetical protein NIES4074_39550 [Cylindrospermum sp. NIES-4074]
MQFILAIAPHATTNGMMVYIDLTDEAALNCQTSIITKP